MPCLHVNEVLEEVLSQESAIDVLKVDTEGAEIKTVAAIDPAFLPRIRRIYLEACPKRKLLGDPYVQRQYGSVCRLTRRV